MLEETGLVMHKVIGELVPFEYSMHKEENSTIRTWSELTYLQLGKLSAKPLQAVL